MKILLLNKNPVISKLVRLSAEKLEYEFEEQTQYMDDLPHYDVIVIDDSVEANLQDLESKCERLICISSGETNTQSVRKILHKPFLPTDLIALMREEEQNIEQESPQEQEAIINDDTPLDLDSLSFDATQEPVQEDSNIYLQDIKQENADEKLNLGENLAQEAQKDDLMQDENLTPNSNENSQETSQNLDFLNSQDEMQGDNLDFLNPQNEAQANDENPAELNLTQNEENSLLPTQENSSENEENSTPDEMSLEPIDFAQIPLPSLETPQNEEVKQDENTQNSALEDEPLEFDSKEIAEIMGLDEETGKTTSEALNLDGALKQDENQVLDEKPSENEAFDDETTPAANEAQQETLPSQVLDALNENFQETKLELPSPQENANETPQNDAPALIEDFSEAKEVKNSNEAEQDLTLNDENIKAEQSSQNLSTEQGDENAEQKDESLEELQTQDSQDESDKGKLKLELDLENADFLQPLDEKPFSIEEKKEEKISFDDLPQNAQFLGYCKERNIEADEIRPVLVDEPKAQSTQDMVKEQLAALNAMDSDVPLNENFADLQGLSEEELQIALGEKIAEVEPTPSNPKESQNSARLIDELSRGISGAITSSIKDEALKAALKGMNMHIDINIKFDEEKA